MPVETGCWNRKGESIRAGSAVLGALPPRSVAIFLEPRAAQGGGAVTFDQAVPRIKFLHRQVIALTNFL